jgi:hypothetical protein
MRGELSGSHNGFEIPHSNPLTRRAALTFWGHQGNMCAARSALISVISTIFCIIQFALILEKLVSGETWVGPWILFLMDAVNNPESQNPKPRSIADTIERWGRMLTVKELAHLLAESPKTTYARVKRGSQPATLVGSSIRFDPYVTAKWLRSKSA